MAQKDARSLKLPPDIWDKGDGSSERSVLQK
jgi:hypothetical protein